MTDASIKFQVPVGSRWRHLRTGGYYIVTGLAMSEGDLTMLVCYRNVKSDPDTVPWARPAEQFLDGRFEQHHE